MSSRPRRMTNPRLRRSAEMLVHRVSGIRGETKRERHAQHQEREDEPREEEEGDGLGQFVCVVAVRGENAGAGDEDEGVGEPEGAVAREGGGAERVAGGELPHAGEELDEAADEDGHANDDVRGRDLGRLEVDEREHEGRAREHRQTPARRSGVLERAHEDDIQRARVAEAVARGARDPRGGVRVRVVHGAPTRRTRGGADVGRVGVCRGAAVGQAVLLDVVAVGNGAHRRIGCGADAGMVGGVGQDGERSVARVFNRPARDF
jgi:hypothetical protein